MSEPTDATIDAQSGMLDHREELILRLGRDNVALREMVKDYEDVLADKRRLARLIDVAMHGEDGAAQQASLCDLVHPAAALRAERDKFEAAFWEAEGKLATMTTERDAAIRALASTPPAPVVGVKPHVIEREIWQAMAWALRHAKQLPGDIMPAYTDTGNSDAETEARHCAARILAALQPQAEGGEG